jgi:hypothetical protein
MPRMVLAYFDRPGTSNGPTEAINGRIEEVPAFELDSPQCMSRPEARCAPTFHSPVPSERHQTAGHQWLKPRPRTDRQGENGDAAASWAARTRGASAREGPYQVRWRPLSRAAGTPGKHSGPSPAAKRYGSSGRTTRSGRRPGDGLRDRLKAEIIAFNEAATGYTDGQLLRIPAYPHGHDQIQLVKHLTRNRHARRVAEAVTTDGPSRSCSQPCSATRQVKNTQLCGCPGGGPGRTRAAGLPL